MFPQVESVLVDLTNIGALANEIAQSIAGATLIGLDIETQDSRRHPGLAKMVDSGKLVFDIKRTDLCGLSIWPENHHRAYYFNFAHADVENRLHWQTVLPLLGLKQPMAKWVIHNATFERTMLAETVGWSIENEYICTLQMAVSAYGPDEYDVAKFRDAGLGDMAKLIPEILRVSRSQTETSEMQETLSKIIAKESSASHSYNGYVGEMAYGYGLKRAVKSFFGYEMATFKQVLGKREHMGQLTGAETVSYGADDAIWCMRLYRRLLQFMMDTNPDVIGTFFSQELPMVEVYSDVWRQGVRINAEAVKAQNDINRLRYAEVTRRLRHAMAALLPFPAEPHAYLAEHEDWYAKNFRKYRSKIEAWCNLPDAPDPFTEASRLRGPIPKAWAETRGLPENPDGLNLAHYMPVRTIIYDLFQYEKPLVEQGKVQSDGYARGRLKERLTKAGEQAKADIIGLLGEIATIEQAQKLYLTPYQALVDPDTDRMYPQLTSALATRRTAMSQPNAQQLAKRGESVYVRGFYLADDEDSVIVSLDLSQIELVTIAEFSGDPEFLACYDHIPYDDLHEIAASGCLGVETQDFRALLNSTTAITDLQPHLLVNPRGETMAPKDAYKYWRVEIGKGSNFEFWYSGLLRNVAEKMGWSREQMFEVGDRYKSRFAVAEEWRVGTINELREFGSLKLPDHHRRVRYEATGSWAAEFRAKWSKYASPELDWFVEKATRRIQTRAGNQGVNALVQGTCATVIKRAIRGIRRRMQERGWGIRDARFMMPIHDEVVYSVNRKRVPEFIAIAAAELKAHKDIFQKVELDSSPSVGLTFAPWSAKGDRLGQIELFEAPAIDCVPPELVGKRLPPEMWGQVVDWLFLERDRLAGVKAAA